MEQRLVWGQTAKQAQYALLIRVLRRTLGDLVDALVRFIDMRKRRARLSSGSLPAHLKQVA